MIANTTPTTASSDKKMISRRCLLIPKESGALERGEGVVGVVLVVGVIEREGVGIVWLVRVGGVEVGRDVRVGGVGVGRDVRVGE